MILEIDIPTNILDDMIREQETLLSSCFINDKNMEDYISQDFVKELLTQYKINKPTNYLNIKISKNND
jgi:hypothetical protein|tara:strand:- start:4165 stop:4368 length:204 start_codon:yes stop_codon:yes gene_type:complete